LVKNMAEKMEFATRDVVLAVGFVGIVIITVALSMSGYITSPMTLGILVTESMVLIFIGHAMVNAKVLSKSALPLWYTFSFGMVLLTYGAIEAGYIPVAFVMPGATVMEIAITNSLFYVIVALSIVAAVAVAYAGYQYYKKYAYH